MKPSNTHNVGFFPENISIRCTYFNLLPLENIKQQIKEADDLCYQENSLFHPPLHRKREFKTGVHQIAPEEKLFQPKLFKFYQTHKLEILLDSGLYPLNEFHKNPTFFFLQILSLIYGYRLLPETFWFDGKIPRKGNSFIFSLDINSITDKGFMFWNSLDDSYRAHMGRILYAFNRSENYPWAFEKFSQYFMIFDSCCKMYKERVNFSHGRQDKFENFLTAIEISYDKLTLKEICNTRNDLFHQMKWGSLLEDSSESYRLTIYFKSLLRAVLFRMMGFEGKYFNSEWSEIGTTKLDLH